MWFQKPPLGTPLDWENPLNDETVLALAMNEGHGDRLQDLSLNGNHGTMNSFAFPPTAVSGWNPGQTGIGLNFDGTNDYINISNNQNLVFGTGDFTLSALVYLSELPAAEFPAIMGKGNTGATEWMFRILPTSKLEFYGGGVIAQTGVLTLLNHWRHCVFVREGDDGYTYMDGVLEGHSAGIAALDFTTTKDLRIGNADAAATRFLTGSVDQPRIMNRAWSAKEVRDYAINPWRVYLDE